MILQKPHVLEKSGSSVMAENAFNKSDWSILWSSISIGRINLCFRFLVPGDNHQGKVGS